MQVATTKPPLALEGGAAPESLAVARQVAPRNSSLHRALVPLAGLLRADGWRNWWQPVANAPTWKQARPLPPVPTGCPSHRR